MTSALRETKVDHNEVPSPAQALVQLSAYRIDFHGPRFSDLIRRLDEELVTEIWQLSQLDSINFQAMDVPIGLVASIRACLEDTHEPNGEDPTRLRNRMRGQRISDISSQASETVRNCLSSDQSAGSSQKSQRRPGSDSAASHRHDRSANSGYGQLVEDEFDFQSIKPAKLETIESCGDLPPIPGRQSYDEEKLKDSLRKQNELFPVNRPALDLPPQSANRRLTDTTATSHEDIPPPGANANRRLTEISKLTLLSFDEDSEFASAEFSAEFT